jgi:hypothetical protein
MVCKERTIHEELAKNVTGLLKSNDSTTVKHVLKVNNLKAVDSLLALGTEFSFSWKEMGCTDFQ